MTRTKWKNRTREDQERIAREQSAQQQSADAGNAPSHGLRDEDAMAIYKEGLIPVACSKCNEWTCLGDDPTHKYIIRWMEQMVIIPDDYILCTCRKCGFPMMRRIPSPFDTEALAFVNAVLKLKEQGRLVDHRGRK